MNGVIPVTNEPSRKKRKKTKRKEESDNSNEKVFKMKRFHKGFSCIHLKDRARLIMNRQPVTRLVPVVKTQRLKSVLAW
jgi:hypothetical protein